MNDEDENLHRLKMMNRYKEKPRTTDEEEEERQRLRKAGVNTFISYEDLEKLAKNGKEYFLPGDPGQGNACFSCGDGRFYKGSLVEIRDQLQTALKGNPENEKIQTGLARINQEFFANPNLASVVQKMQDKEAPQEDHTTTPTPFSTKPKTRPY